ncbi:MAG: adenosylcobalamin-dependent ribonucleoside-diphosphate reductase [bacterium]|nr:adenosylcobalamin-dependent ribonucleoside-diphosphate reductase [bacterium]
MSTISKKQKEQVNKTFSDNALRMMKKRYLLPLQDGTQETPADMFERVGDSLALVEKQYKKKEDQIEKVAKDFFEIMSSKEFTPAGRTLTNAGGETPLIANCIVLPIHDSMESIFQTLKDAALLQQAGCGLGFDLSEMRPADSPTKTSRGRASGPVSFLKVYDAAFGTIKQQGRHGANMAMMRIDHPDVLDFIRCKKTEGEIRNFNISVTVTDEFMKALEKDPDKNWLCTYKGKKVKPHRVLRHPNGSVYDSQEIDITTKELFDELIDGAWTNGEPGIAFIDTVNKTNPLPGLGAIASSNPCGEQFLHPYDNCNLGSINLATFVTNKKVDWARLRFVTRTAVRLMDNVIDKFDFPVPQVTDLARKNRRLGLGIMGWADMLYQLEVAYNSPEGLKIAEKVMGFIQKESHEVSAFLAKEKGEFPNFPKSVYAKRKVKMRNAAVTTVAPTGSISMMLDCSSGIEPNFALGYVKQDKDGQQYKYFNRYFEQALQNLKLPKKQKDEVMEEILKTGSVQNISFLPEKLRKVFTISMDISGEYHMKMQAVFQQNVDNSISKTINLPNSATKEEVIQGFISAWKLGCKSCTVYRDGSRVIQVLNLGTGENIVSTTEAPKKVLALKEDQNRIAPRKRPDMMKGNTYRVKTGYGTLYVTVNNDEQGTPFEVFATIGKSGGFFQEQSEGICRLISLALRSGVKLEEVIDNIKGIRGPMPIFTEKGTILSLPDAIGRILEDHIGVMRDVEETITRPEGQEVLPLSSTATVEKSIANFGFMPGCPDCGAQLQMQEGCMSCKSCGFSRCS